MYISLLSSATDVNSTSASAAMLPVRGERMCMKFSGEGFYSSDYGGHEQLLCIGFRS
jgi:hypothetical protein